MKTAAEVARELADALEAAGVAYAVGGAVALAYYAAPRATVDVDLNVFVSVPAGLAGALDTLGRGGFSVEVESLNQAASDGQFRGRAGGLRVDVFVPAIEYYAELETRRRSVTLLGRPAWILSGEDLVILKMMFFRRKDLADVEAMFRAGSATLDRPFIRAKLAELMGPDDPRLTELAAIERDVDASA